ncbi:hypothetical protein [Citromicrobium bathyomarinum]|uniref:hypothetical protein n=1 Tax=Citromicrobium bathyomarinum TaxID=72174 RepID=UPI00315A6390
MEKELRFLEDRKAHWLEIGKLCASWALLDHSLDDAIADTLDITTQQARCIGTQIEPVASRIKLLRLLLPTTRFDGNWVKAATALLNKIDAVAPQRNRIVHDAWHFDGTTPKRIDKRAKLKKAEAFASDELFVDVQSDCPLGDIKLVTLEVGVCCIGLEMLSFDIQTFRAEGPPLPESSTLVHLPRVESHAHRLFHEQESAQEPRPSEA